MSAVEDAVHVAVGELTRIAPDVQACVIAIVDEDTVAVSTNMRPEQVLAAVLAWSQSKRANRRDVIGRSIVSTSGEEKTGLIANADSAAEEALEKGTRES